MVKLYVICLSLIAWLYSTSFSAPFRHTSATLASFHNSQLDWAGSFWIWRSLLKCHHFREPLPEDPYLKYFFPFSLTIIMFSFTSQHLNLSKIIFFEIISMYACLYFYCFSSVIPCYITGIWQVFVERIKEISKLCSFTGINHMVKSYLQNSTKN